MDVKSKIKGATLNGHYPKFTLTKSGILEKIESGNPTNTEYSHVVEPPDDNFGINYTSLYTTTKYGAFVVKFEQPPAPAISITDVKNSSNVSTKLAPGDIDCGAAPGLDVYGMNWQFSSDSPFQIETNIDPSLVTFSVAATGPPGLSLVIDSTGLITDAITLAFGNCATYIVRAALTSDPSQFYDISLQTYG